MSNPVGEVIAFCPKCNKSIGDQNPYAWCIECGEPLTPEIKAKIPILFEEEQQAKEKEQPPKYNYQKIGDTWQQKGNEQLISAAERLSTSTAEEDEIIHAESQGYECVACKADVSFDDNVCPNCGTDVSEVDDSNEPEPTVSTVRDEQIKQPRGGNPALNRYLDLHRVARLLVEIGNTVKITGIVVGSAIILLSLFAGSAFGIFGLVFGAFVGGIIYLLGTLISAQGQILLAQADSAVHSSPFMTNEERAKVMSLSLPPSVG